MKLPPTFPDKYWQKFSHTPVEVRPHDPQSLIVTHKYIKTLKSITKDLPIEMIYHRGSTAWGIAGKGDIEIGLIPDHNCWFEVVVVLSQHYRGLGNLDEEYARFNDNFQGFEIETILMRGYTLTLDIALHEYMPKHPDVLAEYEQIKLKYTHSTREYNFQKDQFFRQIIPQL